MKNVNKLGLSALAIALMGLSSAALAQKAGDHIVGFSAAGIIPQESSDPLQTRIGMPGAPAVPADPNSASAVNNRVTVGLSYEYMITDNWSVGALAGIPPKFTLTGEGNLANVGKIGEANMYSPSFVAKYHFGTPSDKIRPFLGAGFSYVWFNSIKLTDGLSKKAAAGISPVAVGAGSTADLSKEFAPLITAGASYKINDQWALSGSVSYEFLKVDADITSRVKLGPQTVEVYNKTAIKLNPVVVKVGLNYTF